jgi:response regulator NasT
MTMLPPAPAAHDGAASAEPVASRHATILVCDDDRLVLATLVHGLRSAGFDVLEADNGDDAILLAREHRPDLALLDMRMNGKTGLDVAAYLRDHVGTPFMFLSAFNDERIVREAVDFGALAYLVKPLDVRQIVPAVEAALARSRDWLPPAASAAATGPRAPAAGLVPTLNRGMAIGVLMERHRLSTAAAAARLADIARDTGRSEESAADALVAAAELLNGPEPAAAPMPLNGPGDPRA